MNKIEMEVTVYDVRLEVTGIYHPEEPRVLYDENMEGYPGASADFEVETVQLEGIDITELITDNVIDLIVEQVIMKYE